MNNKKKYEVVFVGSTLYLVYLTLFTLYMIFFVGFMSDVLRVLITLSFVLFGFITVISKIISDSCKDEKKGR